MDLDSTLAKALVIDFCKAWNNLDIGFIENRLAEDFEYSSQMVLSTIKCKGAYLKYLQGKFTAIKAGNDPVTAELGFYNATPCLILTQQLEVAEKAFFKKPKVVADGSVSMVAAVVNQFEAVLVFSFAGDTIQTAALCTIAPGVYDVQHTGIFPK